MNGGLNELSELRGSRQMEAQVQRPRGKSTLESSVVQQYSEGDKVIGEKAPKQGQTRHGFPSYAKNPCNEELLRAFLQKRNMTFLTLRINLAAL